MKRGVSLASPVIVPIDGNFMFSLPSTGYLRTTKPNSAGLGLPLNEPIDG